MQKKPIKYKKMLQKEDLIGNVIIVIVNIEITAESIIGRYSIQNAQIAVIRMIIIIKPKQ